eukprot:6528491-Alexandrium_andersonii.AAC.1
MPQDWKEAQIVGIYKKGSPHDPANFRPISLLNVTYKLFAAVVAARLQIEVEPKLRSSQFGFRGGRSSADPIHIVRRSQDLIQGKQHSTLHLLFLDWSKAFDRLDPSGI